MIDEENPMFELTCEKCEKKSENKAAHVLVEEGWEWECFIYKDKSEGVYALCKSCTKKYPKYLSKIAKIKIEDLQ